MANIRNQDESNNMAKFRTRIEEMRKERGWERQDLLRQVMTRKGNMTYQTIMQWEKHGLSRIDAQTADVFSQIFGVHWHELFVLESDEAISAPVAEAADDGSKRRNERRKP
jgi:transcriptional regulator with XRE-family HTH domain